MVQKTRQRIPDGGEYYGPYVSAVEQCVRYLRKVFRVRNCRVRFGMADGKFFVSDKAGKTIPCMDYYIGLCPAPCLLTPDALSKHEQNILSLKNFLDGNTTQVFSDLDRKMREHAKSLEFEDAANIKTLIESLKVLSERQSVRDIATESTDIIVYYAKYDRQFIGLTMIRRGQIVGVFRHEAQAKIDFTESEVIEHFIAEQYRDESDIPSVLLLQKENDDSVLSAFLEEKRVSLEVPKIGKKKELVDFTLNQVREYAYKLELSKLENRILTREHMVHVLEKIGYSVPKK